MPLLYNFHNQRFSDEMSSAIRPSRLETETDFGVRKAGETDYVCFPKNEPAIH